MVDNSILTSPTELLITFFFKLTENFVNSHT